MRLRPTIIIATLSTFVWAGCASTPPSAKESLISPIASKKSAKTMVTAEEIEKVEFGVLIQVAGKKMYGVEVKVDGEQLFGPDDVIRKVGGTAYGWRMHIKPEHRNNMNIIEVLRLPSPSEKWEVSKLTRISRDKRTATTTLNTYPDSNGTISNEWIVTQDDPVGTYTIKLYLDGQHVATHAFEVK